MDLCHAGKLVNVQLMTENCSTTTLHYNLAHTPTFRQRWNHPQTSGRHGYCISYFNMNKILATCTYVEFK